MENLHLNHAEDRIAKGIAGLKSQAMPHPPRALVDKMIATGASHRDRSPMWIWKAAVACGALGMIGLAVLPRTSLAALTLDQLVDTHTRSDVLFRVTPYWIEGKKRIPKIWHGYVKGDRWHYIQSNYQQASDGKVVTTYLPGEGRAMVWTATDSDPTPQNVLGGADLSWWKSADRKGLSLEHNYKWNGQLVDRYEVRTTSKAWGPSTNVLYADPIRGRPLYSESIHASGNGSAMKWDYPNPADEGVLVIEMKSGTRIEDVTAERARTRRLNGGNSEAATKAIGGR